MTTRQSSRRHRLDDRVFAACGALYVVLLVVGDDFVNPAGEVPDARASLSAVTSYVESADTQRFWLGRSIGLLGLCALLVFVAYVSRRIRISRVLPSTLSAVALATGSLAVTLQFVAAPPVFAAVEAGSDLDAEISRALIGMNMAFGLSFLPLGFFLGCVAFASLRDRLLPRWLGAIAGLIGVFLIAGLVGRPQDPAVSSYFAFALGLLWFVAASIALMREPTDRSPTGP